MCDKDTQCSSPYFDEKDMKNKRCKNEIYKTSKHCKDHYQKSLELYLAYKCYCQVSDTLDIHKSFSRRRKKIDHLLKCHDALTLAYQGRLEHRNYAFSPECFDYGHNKQFEIIEDKIAQCSVELEKLKLKPSRGYMESLPNEDEDDEDHDDDNKSSDYDNDDKDKEYEEVMEKMQKFKIQQKLDSQHTERMFQRYINENKKVQHHINLAARKCTQVIATLCGIEDNDKTFGKSELCRIRAMHYMIHRMSEFGFIVGHDEDDYEPQKCDKCKCTGYSYFDFVLAETITKADEDKFSHMNGNFRPRDLFPDATCPCEAEDFYDTIIGNINNIEMVADQLMDLYNIHGKTILQKKLALTWNPDEECIELVYDMLKYVKKLRR